MESPRLDASTRAEVADPSRIHVEGMTSRALLEQARGQVTGPEQTPARL